MSMTTYRILTFGSKRVQLDLGAIWVMFMGLLCANVPIPTRRLFRDAGGLHNPFSVKGQGRNAGHPQPVQLAPSSD